MELAKEFQLGENGKAKVELKGLQLVVSGGYAQGVAAVEAKVGVDVKVVLEVLKAKIPGTIDDALIDVVLAALEPAPALAPSPANE